MCEWGPKNGFGMANSYQHLNSEDLHQFSKEKRCWLVMTLRFNYKRNPYHLIIEYQQLEHCLPLGHIFL